jgi:hypothetical protein
MLVGPVGLDIKTANDDGRRFGLDIKTEIDVGRAGWS